MNWAASERISVVIPALDEAGNIGRLIEETFTAIPEAMLAEVIVVDDCSNDRTTAEVRELMHRHPQLRLLRHLSAPARVQRSGPASVSRPAISSPRWTATARTIRPIFRAWRMLWSKRARARRWPAAFAPIRKAEGSKRLASKFANWLRDALLDDGCPDTGCGIKVFWRQAFLDLPFFCGMHRYMPAMFQTYGHAVVYLPVNDRPRRIGTIEIHQSRPRADRHLRPDRRALAPQPHANCAGLRSAGHRSPSTNEPLDADRPGRATTDASILAWLRARSVAGLEAVA